MIVENGRIVPTIISVGRVENWRYRYGVTLPWFSTWIDVDDRIHEEEKMNVHHPIVREMLQDAVGWIFNFGDPVKCFFYNEGDDPRLWGSI